MKSVSDGAGSDQVSEERRSLVETCVCRERLRISFLAVGQVTYGVNVKYLQIWFIAFISDGESEISVIYKYQQKGGIFQTWPKIKTLSELKPDYEREKLARKVSETVLVFMYDTHIVL